MLRILAGPAGAGKTQALDRVMGRGEVLIDFSLLFLALAPKMKGRERSDFDPRIPLTSALFYSAIRQARKRELSGWITTATGDRASLSQLQELAGTERVYVLDPGPLRVLEQLGERIDTRALRAGGASRACFAAAGRWFGMAKLEALPNVGSLVDFDLGELAAVGDGAAGYVSAVVDVDLLAGASGNLQGVALTAFAVAALRREVYKVENVEA